MLGIVVGLCEEILDLVVTLTIKRLIKVTNKIKIFFLNTCWFHLFSRKIIQTEY